jgi:hypothetical protein
MSRSGNVWNNAAIESFFSSLKTDRTARKTDRTRNEARADSSTISSGSTMRSDVIRRSGISAGLSSTEGGISLTSRLLNRQQLIGALPAKRG